MNSLKTSIFSTVFLAFSTYSYAAGMVPETSVVLVSAQDGEGTISVTNTDNQPMLLYTSIENLPEDTEELLLVTAPISRVEGGEKQLVRFIIQTDKPIITQRLKRVIFEGIPPQRNIDQDTVHIAIRQNLPIIITPKGLPPNHEPWKLLHWNLKQQKLMVRNESRYVVRLNQQVELFPSGESLTLTRPYILPGQTQTIELPVNTALGADTKIRIFPATSYGFQAPSYEALLHRL